MKSERLNRLINEMMRDNSRASQLALGALLLISILYASTIT